MNHGSGLPSQHLEHVEVDHHAVAVAVAVAGGEVAVDAAADPVALGAHADALDHVEAAVGVERDLAVVGQDAFLRVQEWRQRGEQEEGGEAQDQGTP